MLRWKNKIDYLGRKFLISWFISINYFLKKNLGPKKNFIYIIMLLFKLKISQKYIIFKHFQIILRIFKAVKIFNTFF
jgi:hypothetical protein